MPVLPIRELYCPSHFGNSYEVALDNEMREILSEAKFWGLNRYADWFDTIDLYDVYNKKHDLFNLPEAMWARKFANFQIASELGFDLTLVITPNHVFSDQVTPANEATKGSLLFGQLVCPSKPGAMEMILKNYRNLFEDFSRRGLRIGSIAACPYDYGGCACEQCKPWIVTCGKLVKEIAGLGKNIFGSMNAELIGWWWTDEDHRDFTAWADREAPGLFKSLAFHLPYNEAAYKVRPIPAGCRERAFVHIAYGETNHPIDDAYGHYGPVIAPDRLEKTCAFLAERTAAGFMAYSEGVYDEINKALLAGITSGQFPTADKVLQTYAQRHFGTETDGWAEWLRMMGNPANLNLARARNLFKHLKVNARESWRLEQLELRLIMLEADRAVRSQSEWNPQRLEAAKTFWDAKERLYRKIWALGLTRHGFRFDAVVPDWHEDYLKIKGRHRDHDKWNNLKQA